MLSPRYLDGLSDELAEIYSQLETDILTDMARRIARLGKVTDATKWQAQMLAEAGGLKRNIPRLLSKYDKAVANQVIKAFDDALKTNTKNDNKIFKAATGRTVSAPNVQAMLSTIQKCHSDLSRLTLTTAATSQEQFVQQANRSFMDVMSGAFDYDTAMKNAADELSDEGIRTVQYENGKPVRRSIESAVRMNIITSINQTAANQTLNNCEELGCDLVETSAHIGARPEHEDWQGEVFSLSGANKKYRPFSVCGLGTPTGICGINCRHSYYPYFEEMDEHYTQDDLDEMSDEKVTYTNGDGEERELSRYEGEQKLRGIERKIRFYKKRALTEEAAGADNTASRQKLGEWQAKARDFTEQTGIRRDYAREYVGTKGEQPRGIAAKTEGMTPPSKTTAATSAKTAPIPSSLSIEEITAQKMLTLVDNPKSTSRTLLEKNGVLSQKVFAFAESKTESDIISRIAGGDKTKGSCSSVANAYIANKGGFNVLDFRGGKSLDIFSKKSTSIEMAKFNGVESVIKEKVLDQVKAGQEMLDLIEVGKEYKLGVGRHAAIVRKLTDGTAQYLELQSPTSNGWKNFTTDTFKNRFACKRRRKYTQTVYLIELSSLAKNKEFIELMQYLNTSDNAQQKGSGGRLK